MVEVYDNRDKVPLSFFAKSIEYIPLETNEESLIGRGPIFQATKEQIILSASNHVLVFSREDGDSLKKLERVVKDQMNTVELIDTSMKILRSLT